MKNCNRYNAQIVSFTCNSKLLFHGPYISNSGNFLLDACNRSDLRKLKVEKNMFLVIDNVNSGPVYCHYHIIFRKTGAWELISFIEPGEQQRPFKSSVVDNVFFDFLRINFFGCVVSLRKHTNRTTWLFHNGTKRNYLSLQHRVHLRKSGKSGTKETKPL